MIEVFNKSISLKKYKPITKYQNVIFKEKVNIDNITQFFLKFPEEKRGRKNFYSKEVMNTKTLLYNEIFKEAKTVKANCIASIKEKLINDEVIITVSFYKKMTEHKPLFVDLDGTLIKEDLSNLAFQNS